MNCHNILLTRPIIISSHKRHYFLPSDLKAESKANQTVQIFEFLCLEEICWRRQTHKEPCQAVRRSRITLLNHHILVPQLLKSFEGPQNTEVSEELSSWPATATKSPVQTA